MQGDQVASLGIHPATRYLIGVRQRLPGDAALHRKRRSRRIGQFEGLHEPQPKAVPQQLMPKNPTSSVHGKHCASFGCDA